MHVLTAAVEGAGFLVRTAVYLRRPLTLQEAHRRLGDCLQRRSERFLDRLRRDVFGQPDSLYQAFFRHAGCQYGDIENVVRSDGVGAALLGLFREGVYLTIDEFKGRISIRRGSFERPPLTTELRSPRASGHLTASSGGSRSSGTAVFFDFGFVRDCAANVLLCLDAYGGSGWRKGDWETPGAGARFRLLKFAAFGSSPEAWFSQIDPRDPSMPSMLRYSTAAFHWASRLAGRTIPYPVYAGLLDPTPVAEWLARVLKEGGVPLLFTFPGSAVRLCLTAAEKGINIAGSHFMLSGEPITSARLATLRRTGAIPIPRYGSVETGAIGYGCLCGNQPDEIHAVTDMHALIHAGSGNAAGLPEKALLITNLHSMSPFLMINVSMGDQAELEPSRCDCPLARLGWTTTLHQIRSYEKLTGNGVTFLGVELIRILEQVLPTRFGGAPTDYQLIEEEDSDGQPRVSLLVHPSIAQADEGQIAEQFLSELAAQSPASGLMVRLWRDSGTFRIVRRPPMISRAGKILHLHLSQTRAVKR